MRKSGSTLAIVTLFVACNSILGNEEDYRLVPGSTVRECRLRSQCETGELCLFGACSPPCAKDIDCDQGSRCLKTESGVACVTVAAASCTVQSCPPGTVCWKGECRTPCSTEQDCVPGQLCASEVCLGTDPSRDPGAELGAGGAGTGGEGGSGGADGGGGGQSAEGGSGQSGGAAGAESSGGEGGSAPSDCVPRGEEDCLNGIDDDCNGVMDCADDACAAPVTCVPEVRGAALGTFVAIGASCPTGFSPVQLHRGLNVSTPECTGCSCVPNDTRCESGVYGHGPYACPSYQYDGLLYNVFSDRCGALPQDTKVHFFGVRGFTTCTPMGTGVPSPTTWTESRTFCVADRLGGGCPTGQRCIADVSTPECAMAPGEASCGAAYPNATDGTWYEGLTDDRTCTCSCAFGTANCAGAYIQAFDGAACTGNAFQLGSGQEGDICDLGVRPASGRVVGTPTNPSCESNTFPIGEATATDPNTVCCR